MIPFFFSQQDVQDPLLCLGGGKDSEVWQAFLGSSYSGIDSFGFGCGTDRFRDVVPVVGAAMLP